MKKLISVTDNGSTTTFTWGDESSKFSAVIKNSEPTLCLLTNLTEELIEANKKLKEISTLRSVILQPSFKTQNEYLIGENSRLKTDCDLKETRIVELVKQLASKTKEAETWQGYYERLQPEYKSQQKKIDELEKENEKMKQDAARIESYRKHYVSHVPSQSLEVKCNFILSVIEEGRETFKTKSPCIYAEGTPGGILHCIGYQLASREHEIAQLKTQAYCTKDNESIEQFHSHALKNRISHLERRLERTIKRKDDMRIALHRIRGEYMKINGSCRNVDDKIITSFKVDKQDGSPCNGPESVSDYEKQLVKDIGRAFEIDSDELTKQDAFKSFYNVNWSKPFRKMLNEKKADNPLIIGIYPDSMDFAESVHLSKVTETPMRVRSCQDFRVRIESVGEGKLIAKFVEFPDHVIVRLNSGEIIYVHTNHVKYVPTRSIH